MEIIINGKIAALKKGTSFEYISENRYFTGSDSYTLTITFPLRGCQQNIDIFGYINRNDVDKGKVVYNCDIRDRGFFRTGSITITEINEIEVKTQFLEGRSEQNFDATFDDVYINELNLGSPSTRNPKEISATEAIKSIDEGNNYVALPWVNDFSGNIQNELFFHEEYPDEVDKDNPLEPIISEYRWGSKTVGLSFQPYLIYIAKQICSAMGYTFDFSQWEKSKYRYLLICNTLPYDWDMQDFAIALPHWSVAEFFEKLELFLNCEFDINHKSKSISFNFSKDIMNEAQTTQLTDIIDEYSVSLSSDDDNCDYRELQNIIYKDCSHEMWKYYSCNWFINEYIASGNIVEFESIVELIRNASSYKVVRGYNRGSITQKVLYARDVNTYFAFRAYKSVLVNKITIAGHTTYVYDYYLRLQPLNQFGGNIISDTENAKQIELEFVPAWIDDTDDSHGDCLFLSFSNYNEEFENEGSSEEEEILRQPRTIERLVDGENGERSEYFNCVYIGYWPGQSNIGKYPCPILDKITVYYDMSVHHSEFSLRVNEFYSNSYRVDARQKYSFSFLSNEIPNVRSIFFIKGKKYICEKITAVFSVETGMSKLLKGIFWKIED